MPSNSDHPLLNLNITAYPSLKKNFDGTPILNGLLKNGAQLDRMLNEQMEEKQKQVLMRLLRINISRFEQICNEWLNTGHYSDIPDHFRLLYAFICAHGAKLEFLCGNYLESLHACDKGLLKGNDLEDGSLSKFASVLCRRFLQSPPEIIEQIKVKPTHQSSSALPNSIKIPALELPSLESFYAQFFSTQMPLIIRGMVTGWPAFDKWSFSHLNAICGHRLVPVELGSKYTEDDWRQQLMSFHQYLAQYVFPSSTTPNPVDINDEKQNPITSSSLARGYLAQHRLLDQVPELFADLPSPDYCAFGQNEEMDGEGETMEGKGEGAEEETMNVFIGPDGTVSPLHTDPRHNFFCQIRGRKFVRLISPEQRDCLYLYQDLMRQNTSQVDVECPDLDKFPRFASAQCHDAVLESGECLFIPRGWFHHVRALEPSISVSIWFGKTRKTIAGDAQHPPE